MLVLTRKVGEVLLIGDNVKVIVQRIGKGKCSLAIEAPPETKVMRGELLEKDGNNHGTELR